MERLRRDQKSQKKNGASWASPDWKGPKILYVEDISTNWEITRASLESYYDLTWARSSTEVFQLLQENTYDIILMDIELQGSDLDGIQITQCLRGLYKGLVPEYAEGIYCHDTAISFVTAYVAKYQQATLLEAGGDGLVSKTWVYS